MGTVQHGTVRLGSMKETGMATSQQPRLAFLDRFLPVWIIIAMVLGLLIGHFLPGIGKALSAWEVGGISLPIALGLLVMMYPPLAKVRYEKTREITPSKSGMPKNTSTEVTMDQKENSTEVVSRPSHPGSICR